MLVEFELGRCRRSHLHLMEITNAIRTYFKRVVAALSPGSHADRWVLYIALPPSTGDLSLRGAVVESAVVACLQETLVRGVPRVTQAQVVPMDLKIYDPVKHEIGKRTEWAVITQGSNMEPLITLPAVDFERCATSYVHDVYKICGIEGARRWLDENIEDLVRSCKSRVDVHHTKLIADVMTRPGAVTPMTRNGLQNSTDSVCRLFFEDVLENIKRGGVHAQRDPLQGVPESIMMGITAPIGTGATTILEPTKPTIIEPEPKEEGKGEDDDLRVRCGVREVPCRPRPCRFFQQFVPLSRNGRLHPALAEVIPSPLPSTASLVSKRSAAPIGKGAVTVTDYQRRPLWQPPSKSTTVKLEKGEERKIKVEEAKSVAGDDWWWSAIARPVQLQILPGGAISILAS
jgi:hypothetical protein